MNLDILPAAKRAAKEIIQDCLQDQNVYLGGDLVDRVMIENSRVFIFRVAVSSTNSINRNDETKFAMVGEAGQLQAYHIYDTANQPGLPVLRRLRNNPTGSLAFRRSSFLEGS
jgi:hypothetical protein